MTITYYHTTRLYYGKAFCHWHSNLFIYSFCASVLCIYNTNVYRARPRMSFVLKIPMNIVLFLLLLFFLFYWLFIRFLLTFAKTHSDTITTSSHTHAFQPIQRKLELMITYNNLSTGAIGFMWTHFSRNVADPWWKSNKYLLLLS